MVFKFYNSSKDCKELIVIVIINYMYFFIILYSFVIGRFD